MATLKIIYMGTPGFAVPPLEALIHDTGFEVVAVITQEDKKVGRKQIMTPPPVKKAALMEGISVLQPSKLKNNPEMAELLKNLKPDFFVVVAYGQILPPEILRIPKYGCVNIHGSLLPRYRGASPIEETLRNGDRETGITYMLMDEGLDSGPILEVERMAIDKKDTSLTLREKMSIRAASLVGSVLRDFADEVITPLPQKDADATYCHKINKSDGLIDPENMTAEEILNRLRAYTPWPGCYLMLGEQKLDFLDIETDIAADTSPGKITDLKDGKIGIGTKKGMIIPLMVKLSGKNPMAIQDFLRGNRSLLSKWTMSPKR